MRSKKFLALLLALVMVLGLSVPASAVANEKVQINNMLVDAALVENSATEELVPQMVSLEAEAAAATAAYNPSDNPAYAPINAIAVDWAGYEVAVGALQGRVVYRLALPGASAADLSDRTLTFTISNRTALAGDVTIVKDGTNEVCVAGKNESDSMTVDLATNTYLTFTATWNDGSAARSVVFMIHVTTPAVASVDLTSLTVAGTAAVCNGTTVGGVTRYSYAATLPAATATTTLDAATMVVVPQNTTATMTLKNADGTVAATGTKANGQYTFSNVDFNAGAKTLTVTCGALTRDYQVSASIDGQKVNVHFAIRTYLANHWLYGLTTYYDHNSNGFGNGDDLTDAEWEKADAACSGLATWNQSNTPEYVDPTTERPVFSANSYVTIEMDADANVMDVLMTFVSQHPQISLTVADGYVSEIKYNNDALGEFTCGQGSGWMYTARSSRTDVTSALPNAGATTWAISDGMYIDWYYTAAYGADFGYSIFDM